MKLIVNADDFGRTRGINYGIVECMKNGILTSTTIMMNMPYAEHAVKLAKKEGIHTALDTAAANLAVAILAIAP